MMAQGDEDYSDYSRHISTLLSGLNVVNGFVFTAIVLLLTRLAQPSMLYSQLVLMLLVLLFYLNGLLAQHLSVETLYFCKKIPPQTRKIAVRGAFTFLTVTLFGLTIPFMLLLFDLVSLAILSIVVWVLVSVADFVLIYKPLREYRRKHFRG